MSDSDEAKTLLQVRDLNFIALEKAKLQLMDDIAKSVRVIFFVMLTGVVSFTFIGMALITAGFKLVK